MITGYTALIAFIFSLLLIVSQRVVARHQGKFRSFIFFTVILLFLRMNRFQENLIGIAIALAVSYLFWLLIGRYNKMGNPDAENIKVYGLDD
jgi:predicted PurR-regulated permease PerM